MKSLESVALAHAAHGFNVFPLRPGTKLPFKGSWKKLVTQDPVKIKRMWGKQPKANVGIATGNGLVVIDRDDHKPGAIEAYLELELLYGQFDNDTYCVRTPRGGLHVYLRTGISITNSQGTDSSGLGKGIDTRGEGGYVVASGSRTKDGIYADVRENGGGMVLNDCPDFVSEILGAFCGTRESTTVAKGVELDSPAALKRATDYSQHAPPALEGDGGDLQTFKVAAYIKDLGISLEMCLDLMLSHYNHRCEPPWEPRELTLKVNSAYKNSQDAAGSKDAKVAFDDDLEGKHPTMPTFAEEGFDIAAMSTFDLDNIPPREWVLGRRLIAGYVSALVAPGGTGKSTYAILEALAVASGRADICGLKPYRPGKVLIYNTEDPRDEMFRRLLALCEHHNIDKSVLDNVYVESGLDRSLIVAREDHGVIRFTKQGRKFQEFCKRKGFKLIVIDPLVSAHQVDENSNVQMDAVVKYFGKIANETRAAISIVHHTYKMPHGTGAGDQNTARGASAIVNATRISSTMTIMSVKEAETMRIPPEERRQFIRLDNAKGNMSPPAFGATWFKLHSVRLYNGDSVGVMAVEDMADREMSKEQLAEIVRTELAQLIIPLCDDNEVPLINIATKIERDNPHLFNGEDLTSKAFANRIERLFKVPFVYDGYTLIVINRKTAKCSRWLIATKGEG